MGTKYAINMYCTNNVPVKANILRHVKPPQLVNSIQDIRSILMDENFMDSEHRANLARCNTTISNKLFYTQRRLQTLAFAVGCFSIVVIHFTPDNHNEINFYLELVDERYHADSGSSDDEELSKDTENGVSECKCACHD